MKKLALLVSCLGTASLTFGLGKDFNTSQITMIVLGISFMIVGGIAFISKDEN